MIDEEDLTENFKTERPLAWMFKQSRFWLEILIMLVVPLPFDITPGSDAVNVVEIASINWIDNSDHGYAAQSHKYMTPYMISDFCVAFMFLRWYFFALAVVMFSPVNERLYGKRVCQDANFDPDFSFQIKAGMRKFPIGTFVLLAAILIISLSYVIRIFERPYYAWVFNFNNAPEG